MKIETKTMLVDRLTQLRCDRLPDWVTPRLTALAEAEAAEIAQKAEEELRARIARVITPKAVAAAIMAGPAVEEKRA